MKAKLCSLFILLLAALVVRAEPASTSRILVLDNENLLEGEITRVEGGYQIRRATGGDLILPNKRVLAIVSDRKGAFSFVAERANVRDADERLRLARWCAVNELPAEALVQAKAAMQMRPGFAAAERLVANLELAVQTPAPKIDPAIVQGKAEAPARESVAEVPVVDYNSESFPLFVSKVNAILTNACATCHARNDVKVFKLTRLGGRSGATKNLLAALPQVNSKDPGASAILVKAVTPHGGGTEATFKTRAHPAYQTLETWVRFARSPEGTLEPDEPLPSAEPKKLPVVVAGESVKSPMPSRPGEVFGEESTTLPGKPLKKQASDQFDPAIFNGEIKKK